MLVTITVSLRESELPQLTALLRSLETARTLAYMQTGEPNAPPHDATPPLHLVVTKHEAAIIAATPVDAVIESAALPEKVTVEEIKRVTQALAQSVNMKAAVDLLDQFGAKRTSEISMERWDEYYLAATNKILVAKGA